MEFECGCSEIDYILEHLAPEDKVKIPNNVFDFFSNNKSLFYIVNIDETKPLEEQELRDETKAFLNILYYKYFATVDEKEKFEHDMKNINLQSSEKMNFIDFDNEENKLIIYKENKILKFLKKIFGFFHKK